MNTYTKNKFYEVISKIVTHNVSDIHVLEEENLYVRNASWEIKSVDDTVMGQEEIYWFLQDILPPEKLDSLMEWDEVDTSYAIAGYRFRINAFQDNQWIRMALRKISWDPPTLEEIWFGETVKKILNKTKWLVLVTWPTGSWKSTSLAAMIDYINEHKKCHILTLEDPIEFVYQKKNSLISQRDVWKNTKSWNNAIKYSLRQDPDVVMVWEMRDLETISSVLTLVETWHLVLSTLHTVNAVQTISRIIDVFPANQQEQIATQLSLSLELVVSQQLVPLKSWKWRKPAREVLVNTPAVSNNIRERKIPHITSIIETGYKYWMFTMDQSLAKWVANNDFSWEEVLPKVKSLDSFKTLVKYYEWWKDTKFRPVD